MEMKLDGGRLEWRVEHHDFSSGDGAGYSYSAGLIAVVLVTLVNFCLWWRRLQ